VGRCGAAPRAALAGSRGATNGLNDSAVGHGRLPPSHTIALGQAAVIDASGHPLTRLPRPCGFPAAAMRHPIV
jgi:hypothetical protein